MANRSIGALSIDLLLKYAGFEAGLDKAARLAKNRSKDIQNGFTGAFKVVGASVAGFVAGLATIDTAIQGFNRAIETADRLDELSNRLGISTEQLSAWGYAAKLSGSDLESLVGSLQKFSKTIAAAADANSSQGKLFAALGVSVKDAAGNLRDVEEILPEIADRFKTLKNDTTEAALAQELFGRSGAELLEFLNRGSDGLRELGNEAKNVGAIIDGDTAAAAAEFNDELDKLRSVTNAYFTSIARELLPSLTELVKEFRAFSVENDRLAKTGRLVAGAFDLAEKAFDLFGTQARINAAAFNTLNATLAGTYTTLRSILTLDFSGAIKGVQNLGNAIYTGFNQARGLGPGTQKQLKSGPNAGDLFTAANNSALEQALNKFFQGDSKASRAKGGLSEQEKEAQRLQQAYESLMESMRERIALFGQEGEAARVRHEVEQGALKNLTQAQKDAAIAQAEQYDTMVRLKEQQEAADELVRRETEAFERRQEQIAEYTSDLKFENELLGMGNLEREKAIALRWANVDAMSAEGKEIANQVEQAFKIREQIALMDGVRDEFQGFFADVLTGTKSVKDAFSDMLDNIQKMILNKIAQNWVDQLFGQAGTSQTGAAGNWWGSLIGMFAGGRANGGMVSPNNFVEVNERGIEMATVRGRQYLLAGNSPVEITPNHRLSGGRGDTVVNFNGYGRVDRRTAQQAAADLAVASQSSLVRNGRGGRSG